MLAPGLKPERCRAGVWTPGTAPHAGFSISLLETELPGRLVAGKTWAKGSLTGPSAPALSAAGFFGHASLGVACFWNRDVEKENPSLPARGNKALQRCDELLNPSSFWLFCVQNPGAGWLVLLQPPSRQQHAPTSFTPAEMVGKNNLRGLQRTPIIKPVCADNMPGYLKILCNDGASAEAAEKKNSSRLHLKSVQCHHCFASFSK